MKLIQELHNTAVASSDKTDAGSGDVVDKAKSDVSFKLMRNAINLEKNHITGTDVVDYLERAEELNDEVDTVAFGLETSDGKIVKVYVAADDANAFEAEMKQYLGLEDDVEKAINDLALKFDIIDVVWPDADDTIAAPEESSTEDEDESIEAALNDSEETEDEEQVAGDETPSSETDVRNTPNKMATKTSKATMEHNSIGTNFLNRILGEAKAPVEHDGVRDGFNVPLDNAAKAVVSRFKTPLEKQLVTFFVMSGVPGRYLNAGDIEDRISDAASQLRVKGGVKRAFLAMYKALASAKGYAIPVAEAKAKRGSFLQKMFETILVELGLPDELVTISGPSVVANNIFKTMKLIEGDAELERALRNLALRMGVKASDAAEPITENVDLGKDQYLDAVSRLISAMGIPDDVVLRQKGKITQALRAEKSDMQRRSQIIMKMNQLTTLITAATKE